MKFMLMMNTPGGGAYQIAQWPAKDIQAHIAFMRGFAEKLTRDGELAAAEGLAGPDQAKLVRGDESGKPQTDGVFPNRKSSWPATGSCRWTVPSAPTRSPHKPRWPRELGASRFISPSKCAK